MSPSSPSPAKRRMVAAMFPLIEQYLTGSLAQKQFCQNEHLSLARFKYWLKKYRQTQTGSARPSAPTPFVALHTTPPSCTTNSVCEIARASGAVLRLSLQSARKQAV